MIWSKSRRRCFDRAYGQNSAKRFRQIEDFQREQIHRLLVQPTYDMGSHHAVHQVTGGRGSSCQEGYLPEKFSLGLFETDLVLVGGENGKSSFATGPGRRWFVFFRPGWCRGSDLLSTPLIKVGGGSGGVVEHSAKVLRQELRFYRLNSREVNNMRGLFQAILRDEGQCLVGLSGLRLMRRDGMEDSMKMPDQFLGLNITAALCPCVVVDHYIADIRQDRSLFRHHFQHSGCALNEHNFVVFAIGSLYDGRGLQQAVVESNPLQLFQSAFKLLLPVGLESIRSADQTQVSKKFFGPTLVPGLAEHDEVDVGVDELRNLTLQSEKDIFQQRLGVVAKEVGFDVPVELKISLLVGDVTVRFPRHNF